MQEAMLIELLFLSASFPQHFESNLSIYYMLLVHPVVFSYLDHSI